MLAECLFPISPSFNPGPFLDRLQTVTEFLRAYAAAASSRLCALVEETVRPIVPGQSAGSPVKEAPGAGTEARDTRGVFLVSAASPHIRLGRAQSTELHYRLSQKLGKEVAEARIQALSARGAAPDERALPDNVLRAAGGLCVELSTFLDVTSHQRLVPPLRE